MANKVVSSGQGNINLCHDFCLIIKSPIWMTNEPKQKQSSLWTKISKGWLRKFKIVFEAMKVLECFFEPIQLEDETFYNLFYSALRRNLFVDVTFDIEYPLIKLQV